MLRKRKRMELVRPADRKRRRDDDRPADEVFLSRRTFIFKSLILGGFTALAGKLWRMQVRDTSAYQDRAVGNLERIEPLKAPRGLILDRNGQILAENRVSWSVQVIPAQLPDDPAERQAIRDELVRVLELPEMLVVRLNALPSESDEFVVRSLAEEIGADPVQLVIDLLRVDHPDNLVPVRENLEPAEAERLREVVRQFPGVHVMNRYDYLLELHAGSLLPVVVKKDVAQDVALAVEANRLYLPGVKVSDDTLVRRYPAGPEFSHILGYVGPVTQEEYEAAWTPSGTNPYLLDDAVGRGGLEAALDAELRGTHGLRRFQVDAHGVEVAEFLDRRIEAEPGLSAVLTIDADFQRVVTAALQEGIERANADLLEKGLGEAGSGVAIALDPRNGDVLALVSLPTFDNQLFVDGIDQEQYEAYLNNPYKPLTNLAISGEYPPGSVFKPMIACAGLQEGVVNTGTQYRCVGTIRVPVVGDEAGGNHYVCWLPGGHGPVAMEAAIAASCDIYFYNVAAPGQIPEGGTEPLHYYQPGDPSPHYFHGLGIETLAEYLTRDFGLGKPTGIELAGESAGLVPTPKWLFQSPLREYWSVGDTINVSIGQGHLTVTPLQLACSIAAIANGGDYYRPRLVKRLQDAEGRVVREFAPEVTHRLQVASQHIETVRSGMRLTVTSNIGTAYGKFVKTDPSITVAAKTGTAEFGVAVDGKYDRQHAWFTAFAPYDDPEIVVVVLIPGGGEGAVFAAPVTDEIMAAYFGSKPATA